MTDNTKHPIDSAPGEPWTGRRVTVHWKQLRGWIPPDLTAFLAPAMEPLDEFVAEAEEEQRIRDKVNADYQAEVEKARGTGVVPPQPELQGRRSADHLRRVKAYHWDGIARLARVHEQEARQVVVDAIGKVIDDLDNMKAAAAREAEQEAAETVARWCEVWSWWYRTARQSEREDKSRNQGPTFWHESGSLLTLDQLVGADPSQVLVDRAPLEPARRWVDPWPDGNPNSYLPPSPIEQQAVPRLSREQAQRNAEAMKQWERRGRHYRRF